LSKNVETLLIFAGGLGTRFSEKTKKIPKPLVLLNGKPLIHHIIDHYSEYGYKKIIILSGYKSSKFDKYFKKVSLKRNKNIYTINNNVEVHNLFTGIDSLTSTRLYKGLKYIDDEYFSITYGDGISNVDLNSLRKFHFSNKSFLTITAVRPPSRFGEIIFENDNIKQFNEKNSVNSGWINGGYFITNRAIMKYLKPSNESFEKEPISRIIKNEKVLGFKHKGFWRPVDTVRELEILSKEILTMNEKQ
tara:strand:+ start:1045 stop:1785 length:741 start_codon:yes stop_codon:yes gene_type:complete